MPLPATESRLAQGSRHISLGLWLRWRRGRAEVGLICIYALLAVVVLSPLASKDMPLSGGEDVGNHVSGIIEAREAMLEGQFPIRVAPRQNQAQRYPVFQFYGQLPYQTGAILYCLGLDPYMAFKTVLGGALIVGGFFTYRLCRVRTRQFWPGVVAGAVFITSPYVLCDIHGRFAMPELVALSILPAVFYCLMRGFAIPRWRFVLGGALCWNCLALTHAITFFCASLMFGIWIISHASFSRKYIKRGIAVGSAYLAGLLLAAWYVAPQLTFSSFTDISFAGSLMGRAWLTPLGVLLSPTVVPPTPLPHPGLHVPMHFSLQIGWPVLAALAMTLAALARRSPATWGNPAIVRRLVLLLAAAAFFAWSPFDYWQYLPPVFQYVQFPYRWLMLVVVSGSLLSGFALKFYFRSRMQFEHALVCFLILGVFVAPHLGPHQTTTTVSLEKEIARPHMGRGGANRMYLIAETVCEKFMQQTPAAPGYPPSLLATKQTLIERPPGKPNTWLVETDRPVFAQLPVLFYPHMQELRVDGKRAIVKNQGRNVAVELDAGRHRVQIRFIGFRWANWLSVATWGAILTATCLLTVRLFRQRQTLLTPRPEDLQTTAASWRSRAA